MNSQVQRCQPSGEARGIVAATLADQGDWDTIWYADHYMPDTGTAEVVDGDVYEAWSILSAVAAITS
ncbi:MAG: LLM class flavin-dependent oxidoreductase, partial [Actinomycetia bacterium]|nr:LLM class flavin-dependent oxidoreductase [Actinomycetes bacterium]